METFSFLLTHLVKKKKKTKSDKNSDTPAGAVNCVSFINFPITVSIIFVESGVQKKYTGQVMRLIVRLHTHSFCVLNLCCARSNQNLPNLPRPYKTLSRPALEHLLVEGDSGFDVVG